MKRWLWLVLFAGSVVGAVLFYRSTKTATPSTDTAGQTQPSTQVQQPPTTEPAQTNGMESSSGPLGGEITPRQGNSAPQPLQQQNQSPTVNPQPYNPNDPATFPPPVYQPDPNAPPPPPVDPPSYVPPPDNNFDNVEPAPPPQNYVDPVQPYNNDDGSNLPPPPPPPPPVDDEF